MKRFTNIIYYIRMFLLIIHFYLVFSMLPCILDTKIYGYIFLFIYFIFIIKIILEILSKKKRYMNDLIYNLMQIGVYIYIIVIGIKVYVNELYVTNNTLSYFKTNYMITSLLILFILIYSILEFKNKRC